MKEDISDYRNEVVYRAAEIADPSEHWQVDDVGVFFFDHVGESETESTKLHFDPLCCAHDWVKLREGLDDMGISLRKSLNNGLWYIKDQKLRITREMDYCADCPRQLAMKAVHQLLLVEEVAKEMWVDLVFTSKVPEGWEIWTNNIVWQARFVETYPDNPPWCPMRRKIKEACDDAVRKNVNFNVQGD